jgi:hypothetical protein
MSLILGVQNLRDTILWKRLYSLGQQGDFIAQTLANSVEGLCGEATQRIKSFPSLHPQYTLHDEVHLLRVAELSARIIPADVLERLNSVEIAVLILSCYFHDQGMVITETELSDSSAFAVFKENWKIDHPNFKEVKQQLSVQNISPDEREKLLRLENELHSAMITDFVRITHGRRSHDYVLNQLGNDPRMIVVGTNLASMVAKICLSHTENASDLDPSKGYRYDEMIGTHKVNMVYLGIVLRLADILDFDKERTPDSLYRAVHFTSQISLEEWNKHRSVQGWRIENNLIQFTAKCEHPIYERGIRRFMDWIDTELADCHALLKKFPAEFNSYHLELPIKTDRERIEAKDKSYIYHDLEFSLSRDEIVKLLMTEKLYGSESLCIRELLQNALDALRHRKAQIKRDSNMDFQDGKVEFEHKLDEFGREVVVCTDNGIGMDEAIITKFLARAGKSYYRSPEFEKERASFQAKNLDFDPTARFGIGFMSCFMLGDQIKIYTRKDLGVGRGYGKPLIVEINGLSGILVIRNGTDLQPIGTKIEIIGQKKPKFVNKYMDKVRLVAVLSGYALST